MDQMYQIRAIMESTGAEKDAPVIRELLDEALGARRRKAMGIADWEEPPGQEITETLHTLQTLLLKLIKREELVFNRQGVGLLLLKEVFIETRSGREIAGSAFACVQRRAIALSGRQRGARPFGFHPRCDARDVGQRANRASTQHKN